MRSRRGLTLLEVIVVLALLALGLGLAVATTRPNRAARTAQELAAVIRSARWSAIVTGTPTVLLASVDGSTVVRLTGPEYGCDPAAAAADVVWTLEHRGVSVAWPLRGVAFAPDGFPRSCRGDGVGAATVPVEHASARAAVVVSSLGRVRWERSS
jgi:prepilin-type N-terminal cleavage/methylation domain-containing protein